MQRLANSLSRKAIFPVVFGVATAALFSTPLASVRSIALAEAPNATDSAAQTKPIEDELFVVLAIENIYSTWPGYDPDSAYLRKWIADSNETLNLLSAHSRNTKIGIGSMLEDAIAFVNKNEKLVADVKTAKANLEQRTKQHADRTANAVVGAVVGSALQSILGDNSPDTFNEEVEQNKRDAIGNFVVGVGDGTISNISINNMISSNATALRSDFSDNRAAGATVVARLSRHHGWAAGEAGFDGYYSKNMGDMMRHRPRDPFLSYRNAMMPGDGKAASMLGDAQEAARAADMIPRGEALAPLRRQYLTDAAATATVAAAAQINTNYSGGPATFAQDAIAIWKQQEAESPDDSDGIRRMNLGRCYACAGDFDKAVSLTASVATKFAGDKYFAYRYARMLSLAGNTDSAYDWLKYSVALGFDKSIARKDPDLAALRSASKVKMDDLLDDN